MCGRFTLTNQSYRKLIEEMGVKADPLHESVYRPRYNVAPTDQHWILRTAGAEGPIQLDISRWGFMPIWLSGPKKEVGFINARAETLREKPSFRKAYVSRRCLVPADGFYEWTGKAGSKKPIWVHSASGEILYFAGLYEEGNARSDVKSTFTIVTTSANELVSEYHPRMPAILSKRNAEIWMRMEPRREEEFESLQELLKPPPEEWLVTTEVSERVNSTRHDDPGCIEPATSMGQSGGKSSDLFAASQ